MPKSTVLDGRAKKSKQDSMFAVLILAGFASLPFVVTDIRPSQGQNAEPGMHALTAVLYSNALR